MTASFESLDRRERIACVSRTVVRIVATTTALLVAYALVPVGGRTGATGLVRLILGFLAFTAVLGWQLRSVTRAEHPRLRAAEALAIAFVLLVLGFAYTYLSLSRGDLSSISEHLDHVGAVYFALTIITTVGFGDILPRTDAARLVVIAQFLLDLLLIFVVVRVYFGAAQHIQRRRGLPPSPQN